MVVVAQLVRVSVCGTEGRGFESRLPPKSKSLLLFEKTFFVYSFSIAFKTSALFLTETGTVLLSFKTK